MKYFIGMVIAGFLSASSMGQTQTADGQAGARIMSPLMIKAWEELFFGTIVPNTTSDADIAISVDGTLSCPSQVICISNNQNPARFAISGEPDKFYTVTLPDSIMIRNEADASMLVDGFNASQTSGVFSDEQDDFYVGGTLHVGSDQAVGSYTGLYTVGLEYQ